MQQKACGGKILRYCKGLMHVSLQTNQMNKPEQIILHCGTNNLANVALDKIVSDIISLANNVHDNSPLLQYPQLYEEEVP